MKHLIEILKKDGIAPFLKALPSAMANLSPSEAGSLGYALKKAYAASAAEPSGVVASIDVAVLSNGNVSEVCNQLRTTLAACGIKADIADTGFNQWRFQLMGGAATPEGSAPDLVLCLFDEHLIFEETGFSADIDRLTEKLERESREIEALVQQFRASSPSVLVLNTVPLSRERQEVFIDFTSRAKLSRAWHRFNEEILALAEAVDRVYVLDSAVTLQGHLPSGRFSDARLSAAAKMHLSSDAMLGYAKEYARIARAMLGRSKKCLVVDLDNTLWGGVVGDDGVDALEIETGDHGDAFQQFQEAVAALGNQGVILAVNSKNDFANVTECFRRRRMPLTQGSFAHLEINWESKDRNLRRIADALNIGLDSLVFADDSAFECDWVRQSVPEVTVVHLDGSPAEFPAKVLNLGLFDRTRVTDEDRLRNTLYATETQRNKLRSSFESMEAYLTDLCLQVRLAPVRQDDVHRVAQLTQRTNQFNLTTIRMSEADVLEWLRQPKKRALVFDAKDRFGSYGIVGCVFAEIRAGEFFVDNFMMSCRVFSRGIEQSILRALCEFARREGCATIVGRYVRTAKNQMFADFYIQNGFRRRDSDGTTACFVADTRQGPRLPPWISLEAEILDQAQPQEAL